MGVSVARGATAIDSLSHSGFCEAWEALLARCVHGSVFQGPEFVRACAHAEERDWELVLAYEFESSGVLRGILALDHDARDKVLSHAGGPLARRQGWLASPLRGTFFLEEALEVLARSIDADVLRLGPLPGKSPVEWVGAPRRWGRRARVGHLSTVRRALQTSRIEAPLSKRVNTHQLAKLEEQGSLCFEVAEAAREQERWIERAVDWADHRRWTLGHPPVEPSRSARIALWNGLAREGALSVTALQVGAEIGSIFVGVRGDDRLYVDMAVESPHFEQHSPGIVHLAHLETHLLGQGVAELDVTDAEPWLSLHADRTLEHESLVVFFRRRGLLAQALQEGVRALSRRALR